MLSPAMYTIPCVQPLVVQTSSLPSTLIPHGRLIVPLPLQPPAEACVPSGRIMLTKPVTFTRPDARPA